MNWDASLWLVLLVVFAMAEASSVSMTSIWFAAGALAAMVLSLFRVDFWLQAAVFVAVSCVLLALLRPLARKYFTPRLAKTNLDAVVGSTGLVQAPIDNIAATGQVKLGAMEWTARSASGAPIAAGTLVKVERIEGVKVYVTPAEAPVRTNI